MTASPSQISPAQVCKALAGRTLVFTCLVANLLGSQGCSSTPFHKLLTLLHYITTSQTQHKAWTIYALFRLQGGICWGGTALSQPFTLSSHAVSAFWLWSNVVSVCISVTTDMPPTGDVLDIPLLHGWQPRNSRHQTSIKFISHTTYPHALTSTRPSIAAFAS